MQLVVFILVSAVVFIFVFSIQRIGGNGVLDPLQKSPLFPTYKTSRRPQILAKVLEL